jgi:DNA-binding response OmpR family regulator
MKIPTLSRLLAVDVDSDITFMLKVILEQCGFTIDVFNDPKLALINFKADHYDLLLLEVKMPQINGFQLYQEIANIDRNVKVCFFTAYEALYQSLIKQFPNLKAECLITKPIKILDLIKKIDHELVG